MSFIFGSRINLQLGKNFVEILLNRPLRQRQSLRNLPVRMACRRQLRYLQLLLRQLLQACFGKARQLVTSPLPAKAAALCTCKYSRHKKLL